VNSNRRCETFSHGAESTLQSTIMSKKPGISKLLFGIGALATLLASASEADPIYTFTNFSGPGSGTNVAAGTNMNGIANNGASVGFGIDNAGNFTNFIRDDGGSFTALNVDGSTSAMAFGINSAGNVVGAVNGSAFYLPSGGSAQGITTPGTPSAAFGIDDNGNIVGQYTTAGGQTPGFYISNSSGLNFTEIDAPSGPDTLNAQGVNDNGLIVGFYVGTDGQDHGFDAKIQNAHSGQLTGTAIADPAIPTLPSEPGATFVFAQILGINDEGIAVGYYGDSTTSQHGFLYNTHTGQYTFLDDPSEQFDNGVEVTQITGITNSGEITGFYSDANGVFHGFVANPVPEPRTLSLAVVGCAAIWLVNRRRRSRTARRSSVSAA